MRYVIKGAKQDSGNSITIAIDAPTTTEAERGANDLGILVAEVAAEERPQARPTRPRSRTSNGGFLLKPRCILHTPPRTGCGSVVDGRVTVVLLGERLEAREATTVLVFVRDDRRRLFRQPVPLALGKHLVDWNAFDDPAPDEIEQAERTLIGASDRLNRVWERHLHDAAEGDVDVDWP